jgi:hypothetical protein
VAKRITLEEIRSDASKYFERNDFFEKSARTYQAAARRKILDEVCSHMPKRKDMSGVNSPHFKWSDDQLQLAALAHQTRGAFFAKNHRAYDAAHGRRILDKICSHMTSGIKTGEKNSAFKWSREKIKEVALLCDSKGEFQTKFPGAYNAARKSGILDEVCSHIVRYSNPSGSSHSGFKWPREKIEAEASKYTNRTQFQYKSGGAYKAALRGNLLDEVCKHMGKNGNFSSPEQDLFNLIRDKYPKAQKLRIRNRRDLILGKPHIQGFDIDIYIPELRKGIEFDGTYWHSTPGLQRSRKHWPKEDLENYHEIKNDYFKSKGIKILHILESEWKDNPKQSLQKVIEFLGESNE